MKVSLLCLALIVAISSTVRAVSPKNSIPSEIREALANPTEVYLFSVQPDDGQAIQGVTFHGAFELGKARLSSEEAAVATRAVREALENWNGTAANCFEPRHGLRVMTASHTYDFLFCYECTGLVAYRDNKFMWESNITGSPATLNAILRAHRIPLAKQQ